MRNQIKAALLGGVSGVVLALACVTNVAADEVPPKGEEAKKEPTPVEKVVVYGTKYRNRSNQTAPVIDYGLDYFQKFEPLTVGDALKRTPSVTFQSDVLEFDGARLRGLDPGYTQILINGERVPGSGVDRSFFVDRIPAELIERVEIVRSSSADRSGDALAGAINIVLRDAYSLDGGYAKAGGLYFHDNELKPVVGGVFGAPLGEGRILLGGNVQGRHNPKDKLSLRYEPDAGALVFNNSEVQSDVRDGTDYSFNGSYTMPIGDGVFDIMGVYVRTDRTETEHSVEFDDAGVEDGVSDQFEDIFQENYTVRAKLDIPTFGGKTKLKVGYASFTDDFDTTEDGDLKLTDQTDDEIFGTVAQEFDIDMFDLDAFTFKFGADFTFKSRDAAIVEPPNPPEPGQAYQIEEDRFDPYALVRWTDGLFDWEAGVRYEMTSSEVVDENGAFEKDYQFLLPSAHLLYRLSDNYRMRLSVARTVRRPNFDLLGPALLEEEPTEDLATVGNPELKPESAWGLDASLERRLGKFGVAGVNVFYRDVQDRIELRDTGLTSPDGLAVVTPDNIGNGSVWGVEVDLSTPLTYFGLEHMGVFLNYSWLDSDIIDPVTGEKRRFNDQAEYVFNVGFIQDMPEWAASFGVSYREQGSQFNRIRGETVRTEYGGDLEAFIEKRIGDNFVIRLTGSNLLNESKDETFFKWDTLEDQLSGDIDNLDEYELETEKSGPVIQLVGRYAF